MTTHSITAGLRSRGWRKHLAVSAILSLVFTLSGCANYYDSDEYKALAADCAQVVKNLRPIADWPSAFSELESVSDGFIATNLGHKSRADFLQSVREGFPYLEAIAVTNPDDTYRQIISLWATKMLIATAGTQFETSFTEDEINAFVNNKTPVAEEIERPLFGFGAFTDEENLGTCYQVDEHERHGDGVDEDGTLSTNEALTRWEDAALDLVGYIEVVKQCQSTGNLYGTTCAATDYDGDGANYDWAPTPVRNPFLNPFNDESIQQLSEFFWCGNQGLEVNATRSGCE
jgi:hypothetical protein